MNDMMSNLPDLACPFAITDTAGRPVFSRGMRNLLDSPLTAERFRSQEETARRSGLPLVVLNVQPYGPAQDLRPFLFVFLPCPGDGTVCHALPFPFYSPLECVSGEAPRPMVSVPDERFSDKERKVIFFILQGLSARETAARLYVSPRTVENRLQEIFTKSATHSVRELAGYCRAAGTDLHIPPGLLSPVSHVLGTGGAV